MVNKVKIDVEELARRLRDVAVTEPIVLGFSPIALVVIFSQLQVALRHPENTGPTADIAREFIQDARQYLPVELQPFVDAGF